MTHINPHHIHPAGVGPTAPATATSASPVVTRHADGSVTVTLPTPGTPARLTATQAMDLAALMVAATEYTPPSSPVTLEEAFEQIAEYRPALVRFARKVLSEDHPSRTGRCQFMAGRVAKAALPPEVRAARDVIVAALRARSVQERDAHDHLAVSDALGRLAAQLGATVAGTCRDALASGQPAKAVAAIDALIEAGDEWRADGHSLDDIRSDADTVTAALRRVARWASA